MTNDWLNKFYIFYVAVLLVGMVLALMHVKETKSARVG